MKGAAQAGRGDIKRHIFKNLILRSMYAAYAACLNALQVKVKRNPIKAAPTLAIRLFDRPFLAAVLQIDHMGIDSILRIERVGLALFGNHAVGQHHDLV